MKSAFKSFQIVLLLCGVFGADEVKSVSVMEGDSVTLHTNLTQIQEFNLIEWKFGNPVIAQTDGNDISYSKPTEMFRDRLQLDQTGSLTIKNMKTKHSGLYELQISHSDGTLDEKFSVTVYESPSASDAVKAEMNSFSVKEGDSVTLQTDVSELHGDELIVWRSGDEGKLIAKADIEAKSSPLYDTDERFRDRLKLDHQTGSLIITNTRTTDSGFYEVKISSNKQTLYKRFTVAVSEPGLSPGPVVGIGVVVVLLVAAAAAVGVICHRRKISELQKQTSSVSVTEGEDVTLKPNNEIKKGDVIQWQFGDKKLQTLIAEIRGEPFTYDHAADGRFRDRLYLDKTTGHLTIKNTRTDHSGLYKLHIRSSRRALKQRFFVTVKEKVELKSVEYGDSVTLDSDTEIQRDDQILWMFGHQDNLIAQIRGGTGETYDGDEIFRGRLKLDEKTGSLTITNIKAGRTGLYKLLIISRGGILCKKFRVLKQYEYLVTMGKSVQLNTDLPKIETNDVIQWMFGDEKSLIAEIKGGKGEICVPDGRFRDRLELNDQTGDLTIKKPSAEHAGYYNLKICSSKGNTNRTYYVTIIGAAVADEAMEKSMMKEKNDSTGKRVNESAAVEMPLLNK